MRRIVRRKKRGIEPELILFYVVFVYGAKLRYVQRRRHLEYIIMRSAISKFLRFRTHRVAPNFSAFLFRSPRGLVHQQSFAVYFRLSDALDYRF